MTKERERGGGVIRKLTTISKYLIPSQLSSSRRYNSTYYFYSLSLSLSLSLTLSLTFHLYRPSLLVDPLESIQFTHRADECKFVLVDQYCCIGVHNKTFLMSSSLLSSTQQALLCFLGCLARWEASCYTMLFYKCCFQDLFK